MKKVELSPNALEVAQSRYFREGEDWQSCVQRVVDVISSPDISNRKKITDSFNEMIYNMDFIPGGRILRNSGRPRGSLFNCYHLPIGDSIEEIGQLYKDALTLWSEGGGVGVNFSSLRPKMDPIHGKGGHSSGLVSFMEGADFISRLIESGGSRRAAAIGHIDVSHPELIEFIDAKLLKPDISKWLSKDTPQEIRDFVKTKVDVGALSHFNISVMVNNEFLERVEADGTWTFKFKQKSYGTVQARDIWNKIVSNMVECAEPGLINWTNFAKNNSYYFAPVTGTNPCHTGDTLVAVADGRVNVPFKKLEKEGKDVPVFSRNDKTGKVEVKMMRNPRKTGFGEKIFKVYIDDNMYFRTNGPHEVTMYDGSRKKVQDLKPGDRLHHMIKYNASLSTILGTKENKSDYVWLNNGYQTNVAEHRVIAEHILGRKLTKDEIVHHKDYKYYNNSPENLQVMLKTDHDNFHKKDMMGKNNPMIRFPEKNYFSKHKFIGIENGNSKGYTINQLLQIAIKYTKNLERRPLISEWKNYCEKNNYPFWAAEIFQKYGGHKKFFDKVCEKLQMPFVSQYKAKTYKKFLEIKDYTDLDIFWDDGIKIRKVCEMCESDFITSWSSRERSFCSTKCSCKYANQIYQKKTANGLNFKVIKVEEDGYEDLYNGTVDNNHNYYVFVGEGKTKSGKSKLNYINSRNCGETTLSPNEACDLGSLVLPNFITGTVNTNWKKLENTVKLAVRFLDNVIDVNKYVLKDIDINVHNTRRIGIGVIGLAEYLFAKQVRYGSEKAVVETERIMRFIRDAAYTASVELAIEKGAFPKFDAIQYGKASFIRKLPATLRSDIKKYGTRNCSLMALAPTGTISLLVEYTSAIEPMFAKAMMRHDRVSDRMYIHPRYQEMILNDEDIPDWFVDSFDLHPKDHFEMQVACQKYCDASVSKTINLPKETTEEDLSALLLEYMYDLKGVTVYRDGSREGQILNKISEQEVKDYLLTEYVVDNNLEENDITCAIGGCE